MAFQILDKNGEAIPLNTLDKEVVELWDTDYDTKYYAVPKKRSYFPDGIKGEFEYCKQMNWFDSLGYAIHADRLSTWDGVREYFEALYVDMIKKYELSLKEIVPELVQLIDHWESKGYRPHGFED